MSWLSRIRSRGQVDTNQPDRAPDVPRAQGEVRPPWVEYPGVPPWDFFWREAGEGWKTLTWEPYYNSLSQAEQAAYLKRWAVPQDWSESYFDEARRQFWDHVDDPDT